jgi:hypothetical protein
VRDSFAWLSACQPVITENRLAISKDSHRQPSRAQKQGRVALFKPWREPPIIGFTRPSNIPERKPRDAGEPGGTGCFTLVGSRLLAKRSDKVLEHGRPGATQAKETPSRSPIVRAMPTEKAKVSPPYLTSAPLPLTQGDPGVIGVIPAALVSNQTCQPVSTRVTMALGQFPKYVIPFKAPIQSSELVLQELSGQRLVADDLSILCIGNFKMCCLILY